MTQFNEITGTGWVVTGGNSHYAARSHGLIGVYESISETVKALGIKHRQPIAGLVFQLEDENLFYITDMTGMIMGGSKQVLKDKDAALKKAKSIRRLAPKSADAPPPASKVDQFQDMIRAARDKKEAEAQRAERERLEQEELERQRREEAKHKSLGSLGFGEW